MKTWVLLLVALSAASKVKRSLFLDQAPVITWQGSYSSQGFCDENKDVTSEYRAALYDFTLAMYRKVLERENLRFVFSAFNVWRTLAALAERADPIAQQRLFKFLNLPNDPCIRQKFYNIMGKRIQPGDIKIASSQTLVKGNNVKLNPDRLFFVSKHSKLNIASSLIKRYVLIGANFIRHLISTPLPRLDFHGNSVILDSIDYNGLWTTAFTDATVQRAPFYDLLGQKVGAVDLIVIKKKVKITYVPELAMKLLELPVGSSGQYSLLLGLVYSKLTELKNAVDKFTAPQVVNMLDRLKESLTPLNVAIPRLTLTGNYDIRNILEDVGLTDLWMDPKMNKLVSEPAPLPSSYQQRATITLDFHGLVPTPQVLKPSYNGSTGLDPLAEPDFIANRPFLLSLVDKETYSFIWTAAYGQPI